MVLVQRLLLYCGIGKLVCEIVTLLRYRTNLGQYMPTYTHNCDGADWLVKQLLLHWSTVVHHIERERERVCVCMYLGLGFRVMRLIAASSEWTRERERKHQRIE